MAKRGGKYDSGRYRIRARSLALLIAVALLVGAGIGSTLALLQDKTEAVENGFTYGKVSCEVQESFEEENHVYVKRDVKVKNTGNTDAYIRVLLVFTWKDADGSVFANRPVENRDFQINLALSNGWIVSNNDAGAYIYYKNPVAPGESTPILIDSVRQAAEANLPEDGDYALSVEVVADAIQAAPAAAVTEAWPDAAVSADGTLTIRAGNTY